jgi:3'(2'), 5'-bisphosphate nucleotidase
MRISIDMPIKDQNYLTAIKAALKAGEAVMEVYAQDFETELKADGSPVTLADRRSNDIICSSLATTGISIISEESPHEDYLNRHHMDFIWLVDPVDGTKEFTHRNGEFTVNIALIYQQQPVFGIVTAPAINQGWIGWVGKGAFKTHTLRELAAICDEMSLQEILDHFEPITVKPSGKEPVIAVSRSHLTQSTGKMIRTIFGESANYITLAKGSSLKFCLLAEGKAHYYLRADEINEWDIAAGHALLLAAGGAILSWPMGGILQYNSPKLLNPGFIAFSNPEEEDLLRSKLPL